MGNRLQQQVLTSRVKCRKIQLTRTSLKMPTTGRLSEGSDRSWAGIRSPTTTIHLPPWMIIHLPVPEPSQPVKCLVKLPVDEWLCIKFEKLNVTVAEGYPSRNTNTGGLLRDHFIALIHPIQWTIANPVGADRPAKRQKKTSCVSTGWLVPVLCIHQMAHGICFLSRQHDVISSFSFGACTVQTCFPQSPDFLRESVDYDGFSTLFTNILV